jgi:CHAT domain-containing protein
LAGIIAASLLFVRVSEHQTLAVALSRAAAVPGILPARLLVWPSSSRRTFGLSSQTIQGFAIADAIDRARSDRSAGTQHAAGVASLLAGAPAEATRYFTLAARGSRNPLFWSDLGAAYYALNVRTASADDLLASLAASSRALALSPRLPGAAYNFALAVDRLGVSAAAAELWREYLRQSDDDAWQLAARDHLNRITSRRSDNDAWLNFVHRGPPDLPSLERLTIRYPQQARLWAESECLANWSEAAQNADWPKANARLLEARTIGATLRRETGESLLSEAVAAIEEARHDNSAMRIAALTEGHARYRAGKRFYRANDLHDALRQFQLSAHRLSQGHSAMAALASSYAASVLHDADRFGEARNMLRRLIKEDRFGHHALRAQMLYQVARIESIEGRWTESLAASTEAMALYHRIRETGNEGMAALLIAEAYDFIGQPAVAVRYATAAIRLLSGVGDTYRMRVAAAILCRSFMRRQRWDAAEALIRLEKSLDRADGDPVQMSDVALREAVIEQNLGDKRAAELAVHNAAAAAMRVPDAALRTSLLADVNGARGALARQQDAAKSIESFSAAIAYYDQTDRAIQLPQLYLERGRALRELRCFPEAAADFERGIERLERQHSNIADPGSRYGLLDDAHELFAEAASLRLDQGNRDAAFAMLERGRARTLLEQIAGDATTSYSVPTLTALQPAMSAQTLLIEYSVMRGRTLVFLVARDFTDVREIRVDSKTLNASVQAFTDALIMRRPMPEVHRSAAELYDLLMAPVPERSRYLQLVLVPDAALQQVPFSALFDARSKQFLIEQNLLVTAPSAAVFLESRAHSARVRRQTHPTATIVVGAHGTVALPLRPLPELEREAGAVAALYLRPRFVEGVSASVEDVLAAIGRSRVAHFGGHALIDPVDPSRSALVVGAARDGRPGLLDCKMIGSQRFRETQLVVLASCSTLRNGSDRSEGTPNIARSFLAAGVPAVVGTLWDIDDAETAGLVADLHREVAKNVMPAAALRDAQLAALRNHYSVIRHPGSWAAFEMLGAGGF